MITTRIKNLTNDMNFICFFTMNVIRKFAVSINRALKGMIKSLIEERKENQREKMFNVLRFININ